MSKSYYQYAAKPERVYGPAYINPDLPKGMLADSGLEARMFRILIKNRIPFRHHVTYRLPKRDGSGFFTYVIDIVFHRPRKFSMVGKWVTHLEVKGVLTPHDLERLECLEHAQDVKGFIALPSVIDYWERFGLDGKFTGTEAPEVPRVAPPAPRGVSEGVGKSTAGRRNPKAKHGHQRRPG